MVRPYFGAGVAHVVMGLVCMGAGGGWIAVLYTVLQDAAGIQFMSMIPPWATFLLASKIWCGFMFFITGVTALLVKKKGGLEGFFVGLSVLNTLLWAPVLLIINGVLLFAVVYSANLIISGLALINSSFTTQDQENIQYQLVNLTWLVAFPAIGAVIGVAEFIASIVSYSIVCCCRPSSISESHYGYEMTSKY